MRERRRYVLFVFICAALLAVCTLVACNPENSGQETDETIFYTVTFDTQGGSQIAATEVKSGDILGKVDLPTKQCAVFEGFATDASGAEMWNLTTDKVDKAITLYAIWSDAHSWGEWETTKSATCVEDGERARICTVCECAETEVISAAHQWGEWEELVEMTCTTDGIRQHHCTVCGEEAVETVSARGHKFTQEYTVDIAPGCTNAGSESRHCERCDATTDSRAVPALGHDYSGSWLYDEETHYKNCTRCGHGLDAEQHNFDDDGGCECGYIMVASSSDFEFAYIGANKWQVVKYNGNGKHVSIPSTYSNGIVSSIAENAFANKSEIEEIIVPDSIESIGLGAFSGCVSLVSITIPFTGAVKNPPQGDPMLNGGPYPFGYIFGETSYEGANEVSQEIWQYIESEQLYFLLPRTYYIPASLSNVTYTGTDILPYAFENCIMLESFTISENLRSIGELAFSQCNWLTSVNFKGSLKEWCTINISGRRELMSAGVGGVHNLYIDGNIIAGELIIPDGVEKIDDYAFYQNIRITSVVIPDGVKSIGDAAFSSCSHLKDMKLPESVEIIGDGAFSSSRSLENVKLPAGLNTLGRDAFSGCSSLTDIVIPDGVTGELNAFFGCSRLTTITIPSGITGIGDRAFQGCSALTSVVICDGVKSIGLGAFDGCRVLKDIAIPDSVEVIGANAFRYTAWYDLLPIGLIYVGRVLYGYKGTMPADTSLVIREGTVSIAGEAFEMALNLVSLTIPDSVKHIGAMAFFGCVFLTEIKWNAVAVGLGDMAFGGVGFRGSGIDLVFGDGVEKIPAKAFKFDDFENMGLKGANIKSITISSTVTEIGAYAFECPSLTSVTFADGSSWQISQKVDFSDYTEIADSDLADAAIAAEYLKSTYVAYTWRKV